jgi:hypothetical protein
LVQPAKILTPPMSPAPETHAELSNSNTITITESQ